MPSALLPLTAAARQVPANNRWPFCAARVGKRLWSFFGNLSAIETKAIANIADAPKPAGKLGKGPSLAEVCETRLLLNDVVASGRGIVIEVGLQTAELIQDIVGLAVERSDIGGLRWLPARRRGGDSGTVRGRQTRGRQGGGRRRRPARADSPCISARKAGNHNDPAEEKTCGDSRRVFMVPHRGLAPLAPGPCPSLSVGGQDRFGLPPPPDSGQRHDCNERMRHPDRSASKQSSQTRIPFWHCRHRTSRQFPVPSPPRPALGGRWATTRGWPRRVRSARPAGAGRSPAPSCSARWRPSGLPH